MNEASGSTRPKKNISVLKTARNGALLPLSLRQRKRTDGRSSIRIRLGARKCISEKAILLDNMDCTDGKDVSKVRKKVALMEANLKELDEQEQKYSAELETALAEYAELKTQGEQFDPVELHDTRQELRPEMEQTAVQRVKEKYGDKYSHRTMDDSKRDASRHLDEYAESQEIRQIQREREYQQRRQNKAKQERKKQDDWER